MKIIRNKKRSHKFREMTERRNIVITVENFHGKTFEEMYQDSIMAGHFDVPFHYYISRDGTVHEGRKEMEVAGNELPHYETSLYVFVDCPSTEELTDQQQVNLKELLDKYSGLNHIEQFYLF